MLRWVLWFGLVGCGGGAVDTDAGPVNDSDAPEDSDSASDSDESADDTDIPDGMSEEEFLVRQLIAGEETLDDVFTFVGLNGGFPVETMDGTFLFVDWWTGDVDELAGDFNDWTPEPMTEGEGFFWSEVEIDDPEGLRYKFVSDATYWADPWARSYTYDDNGEISYVRPPEDTYRLDRWKPFSGLDLPERELRVYVPAGDGPWPVMYAQDGQNLFDPAAMHGGWRMREAIAMLDEPLLLVGIDNAGGARMNEYIHTDDTIDGDTFEAQGSVYADFVHLEVRPFIEDVYGSTGLDGVMGSSLGGLISLYIAHRYPNDYDFVASLSGTLGWGRFGMANDTIGEMYVDAGVRSFTVYADSGGGDGGDGCTDPDGDGFAEDDPTSSDNYCETRRFVDDLADEGYTWDTNLYHWYEAEAPHTESAWADRVGKPLGIFVGIE